MAPLAAAEPEHLNFRSAFNLAPRSVSNGADKYCQRGWGQLPRALALRMGSLKLDFMHSGSRAVSFTQACYIEGYANYHEHDYIRVCK